MSTPQRSVSFSRHDSFVSRASVSFTRGLPRQISQMDAEIRAEYAPVLRTPTYAVKVFADLPVPMKAPQMLTVVKDCTMNGFLTMVLKKYRHFCKEVGEDVVIYASHCALASQSPHLPNPLPLQRNFPLREGLMEFRVPYPFSLTVTYDPEYLRQRDEEQRRQAERLEAERQLKEQMETLLNAIQGIEQKELEDREALGRQRWKEIEDMAAMMLPMIYAEFQEILALQRFKEEQERIDQESDRQFFQALRQRQADTGKGHGYGEGELQARMLHEAREKQLTGALRQLGRIAAVEAKTRERLMLYCAEECARLYFASYLLCQLEIEALHLSETGWRLHLSQVEQVEWRQLVTAGRAQHRSITAVMRRRAEDAKRQKYQQQLDLIVSQLQEEGQLNAEAAEAEAWTMLQMSQALNEARWGASDDCELPAIATVPSTRQVAVSPKSRFSFPPDIDPRYLPLSWTAAGGTAKASPVAKRLHAAINKYSNGETAAPASPLLPAAVSPTLKDFRRTVR